MLGCRQRKVCVVIDRCKSVSVSPIRQLEHGNMAELQGTIQANGYKNIPVSMN